MTAYTKSTNFASKDTLTSGDPLKIVKGTEINTEFDNIATAVNSKSDTASPTFTGTVTAAALTTTGNTILGDASTDTLNVGNGGLVKDASGNVGIGTTSPTGKFNVGSGRSFFGANSETYSIGVGYTQTRVNSGQVYYVGATDSATPDLIFSSSAGTERMRIDTSGNVGINTTPVATGGSLQVQGKTSEASARFGGNSGGMSVINQSGLTVYTNLSNGSTDTTLVAGNTASTYMAFGIHNGTSYSERMRITSNGGVSFGSSGTAYGTSGQILQSNGDAAPTWVASPIGNGQTWTNFSVGTTRVSGTTYTNSTGKPIQVIVNNSSGSGIIGMSISPVVGGVTLPSSSANATYSSAYVSFIVPTGQTYSVTLAGAGTQQWSELR